ncbi:DUF2975 domain-containing protein [Blastococcus sp. BMG 814]|uniref:DUF2975 domain-containing protein n=1 Tax=Blastococcus carthaginiensis TaxID=3050034 RepID=A0ABT9ID15_9ACTN|nr:DUF2975 domain-containing protein [Blastococcus carthaginiensis]MDP5183463.1 DUF2975 domain-containing protein [Blastococcus carthaginiensis]
MTTSRPFLGRTGTNLGAAVLFVVAAVALLTAVVLPINQLTQPGGSVTVNAADPDEDRSLGLAGLPEGVWIVDSTLESQLFASDLPAGLRALTELPASLSAIAVTVGAWLLARVLWAIHDGRPFDRRNPGRLAGLAAAVVLGGLVVSMVEGVVATAVLEHLDLAGPDSPLVLFDITIPLTPIGLALALLAAAEAFRRGRALEDEVEGMV